MRYNISSNTPPQMPHLTKGLECIKLLASQVSPDMREAIVPMLMPALGSYITGTEFMYPDNTWKEPCGMLAHLVSETGMGKGQFTDGCIEAVMRKFRTHDDGELQKLVDWQKTVKTKASNAAKPAHPDVSFWFPPADVTNPAFIQNAMALEAAGGHTQYYNLPEIEMADQICGGHRKVSQYIRNIFDRQRAGALRATADGVTGNPILRANMTFSSTPYSARKFYKSELYVGTFGRICISYKPRQGRSGKIPRQGKYGDNIQQKLDSYLVRLEACKGSFIIQKLNKLADKMAADMATIADLADDDNLWDMGKRAIINAWKNGCVLYILNGQVWTRAMGELVEWFVYHDLWSKMQVFSDMFKGGDKSLTEASKSGPKNMLDNLEDTFSEEQLEALRVSMDKDKDAKNQLRVWKNRKFITYSAQTGLYTKTEEYLNGKS